MNRTELTPDTPLEPTIGGSTPHSARNRWPAGALVMMGIGVLTLAAPTAIEGPVLLPISPGHALSVLDAIGVLPLLAGSFSLYRGLWRRRGPLRAVVSDTPARAGALVFVGGFGLGLLIASAFSAFFWWWAVGAVLFGTALLAAAMVARTQAGRQRVE